MEEVYSEYVNILEILFEDNTRYFIPSVYCIVSKKCSQKLHDIPLFHRSVKLIDGQEVLTIEINGVDFDDTVFSIDEFCIKHNNVLAKDYEKSPI